MSGGFHLDSAGASQFISSLSKSLQALCHGLVEFDVDVEIFGHLNIRVDQHSRVNYILDEKVEKVDDSSVSFVSNSFVAKNKVDKETKDTSCSPMGNFQEVPILPKVMQNYWYNQFEPGYEHMNLSSPTNIHCSKRRNGDEFKPEKKRRGRPPKISCDYLGGKNEITTSLNHMSNMDQLIETKGNVYNVRRELNELDVSRPSNYNDVDENSRLDHVLKVSENKNSNKSCSDAQEQEKDVDNKEQIASEVTLQKSKEEVNSSLISVVTCEKSKVDCISSTFLNAVGETSLFDSSKYATESADEDMQVQFSSNDDDNTSRPYVCHCGRAFKQRKKLKRHEKIHSGQRPHGCEFCGKTFGRKDHLTTHLKVHFKWQQGWPTTSFENPTQSKVCDNVGDSYPCNYQGCRHFYSNKKSLQKHQQADHNAILEIDTDSFMLELDTQVDSQLKCEPNEFQCTDLA